MLKKKKNTKVLDFTSSHQNTHIIMLSSYIRLLIKNNACSSVTLVHTSVKPYEYSIMPIERFKESIILTKDKTYPI